MNRARLLLIPAVLAVALPLRADIIHLNDGTKIEGELKRESDGWIVTDADGKQTRVTAAQIKSIEKVSRLSPADIAQGQLASLRRSVEALSSIDQIIERYERFLAGHKDTPAALEARMDLAQWKERRDKGLLKVAGKWVSPEEHQRLLGQTVQLADKAREQLKSGRVREADATLKELLTLDANNVSGLYLRGIVALKQEQLGVAKKSFEDVKEQLPDHFATLNNLAVVLWKQKQHAGALFHYDQAMQASPRNRLILDNVAEALFSLPEKHRSGQTYTNAVKRFEEQDAELQKEMARQGLHRWGSTYVDDKQHEEIKKAQEKVKEKLKQLVDDYEKLKERGREIERQLDLNERSMERIRRDASRTMNDARGRPVQVRLPSIYYELRRDNDRLKAEADDILAKMDGFKDKEMRIRQDVPVPEYTGTHKTFDVEGTPFAAAGDKGPKENAPATQPIR
jgi:tetratricopeptide (TPR) repeat protein